MKKELRDQLKAKGLDRLPNILLAAAECSPISKTGGLADVVGTLPKALAKLGADARIITPYHKCVKDKYANKVEHLCDFTVRLGWRNSYVGLERLVLDDVVIYLIDNEQYFGSKIYFGGDAEGEQYAYFCRAVLEAIPMLDFAPDIIHCNDWHTAMLPMLAHTQYEGEIQDSFKYLITLHNMAFQGKYDISFVQDLLEVDWMYYTPEYFEFYGCADFLKGGLVFADKINTVSPTYAEEIKTPYYGEGLDGVLNYRSADVSGIINGIDTVVFNPGKDKAIPASYTVNDITGKEKCKKALQETMGLEKDPEVPIFAMVTRMTEQKGFDLIAEVIDDLMQNEKMQFMLLGSGDARFEVFMKQVEENYKGRVATYIGYNEDLAHLVYAGSDFYVMPSRFEPCGLSQMIAMRYGTVPIVRETGGLKDTVSNYNQITGKGTGFTFGSYDSGALKSSMKEALAIWDNKEVMRGLIKSAMEKDFSFDVSALEYMRLYICML